MIKKFLKLYKKTLKPIEIEEYFDLYFTRIISFALVLLVSPFKFSPNYFTFISMITGLLSGYFFSLPSYKGLIYGVILLEITNIFDCADGQLARYKNISSKFGKTLDGLADIVTYFSIYGGIALHIYRTSFHSNLIFFYALLSIISMFIHIFFFDHFKNQLISYYILSYKEKSEDTNELKRKYIKLKKEKAYIKATLAYLYYLFYKLENSFTNIGYIKEYRGFFYLRERKKITNKVRNLYYKKMKFSVRLWTFLGASSHLLVFIIFAILNKPLYIFHTIFIIYNLFFIIIIFYQKRKLKEFIKNIN